ncbi:hypothetical protein GLOTRDRAFT_45291, partial [Gloeophyllum trabeum ATCC 11539]
QEDKLDRAFVKQHSVADNADRKLQQYWFHNMKKIMREIDNHTGCIPFRRLDFLDLGCCPGGFSSYILTKNRKARGIGVSLPVEEGGHESMLENEFQPRFDLYFADITSFQLGPSTIDHERFWSLPTPISSGRFDLVIVDGHQLRTQVSEYAAPWDIDRLLISQIIIALQTVRPGGTIIIKLTHPESIMTAKVLFLLESLSKRLSTYKPRTMHTKRGSFYAVARGLGKESDRLPEVLHALKELWVEMTFGGEEGKGRFLLWGDLDFAVTTEELHRAYLDRLIELGRGVWDAQAQALHAWFKKKGVMC